MNLYQEFWRWWYADDYSAYLSSWRWRLKRALVIWADGGSCVICNSRRQLQVHHRTYKRIFCEPFHHLTTVCAECHTSISRKQKFSLESFILEIKTPSIPARPLKDKQILVPVGDM